MMDRRRGLMGQAKGGLPSGYKEVQWVGGDGIGAYIDTGLYVDRNFDIYARWVDPIGVPAQPIMGGIMRNGWVPNATLTNPTRDYLLLIGTNWSANLPIVKDYENEISVQNSTILYNGNTVARKSDTNTQYQNIFIFVSKNGSTSSDIFYSAARIFRLTLSEQENGATIRDFVPCYRKSDNEIGMYDLCGSICPLTGTPFYINTGTGEFTAGPAV